MSDIWTDNGLVNPNGSNLHKLAEWEADGHAALDAEMEPEMESDWLDILVQQDMESGAIENGWDIVVLQPKALEELASDPLNIIVKELESAQDVMDELLTMPLNCDPK
jgi:hypothetical protein